MKSAERLGMILAIGSILSGDLGYTQDGYVPPRKPKSTPKKVTPVVPKGHKKFIIENREIWALNYKNALKKFKKL